MYTINQKFGIGKVVEQDEKFVTIYFEEMDETKKLLLSVVTLYPTIEEAENALNPEMSAEEKEAAYAEIQAEDERYRQGGIALAWLREYNAECSKKLMRHI